MRNLCHPWSRAHLEVMHYVLNGWVRVGREVCGSPRDAVCARAGCEGSVAPFVLEPTLNACRLRLSAIIFAPRDQRRVLPFQHCTGGISGEDQRPETAGAQQNRGWRTVEWLHVIPGKIRDYKNTRLEILAFTQVNHCGPITFSPL